MHHPAQRPLVATYIIYHHWLIYQHISKLHFFDAFTEVHTRSQGRPERSGRDRKRKIYYSLLKYETEAEASMEISFKSQNLYIFCLRAGVGIGTYNHLKTIYLKKYFHALIKSTIPNQ